MSKARSLPSRLPGRLIVASVACLRSLWHPFVRRKPTDPKSILVLHHLLLGDTLMLTALLKKLRERYPAARLSMTCSPPFAGLYASRPYGVEALPFHERDLASILRLFRLPRPDLTIIPAENRLSLLARAIGSRWSLGFGGDRPRYKNAFIDELHELPVRPMAWADIACLLVEGPPPAPYTPRDWPAPELASPTLPHGAYAVLHVGASSTLKLWAAEKWRALAAHLEEEGLEVVFSAGPGEAEILRSIDPGERWRRHTGDLSLPQLRRLVGQARVLVCPDTGVAHLARITGTPVVVLFGGGSSLLFGGGEFWRHALERKITLPDFPCRDQQRVFRRTIPWAATCARKPGQCESARCMAGLTLEAVRGAVTELLAVSRSARSGLA